MGLREKVALIITVISLIQIISGNSSFKSKTPKNDDFKQNQKRSLVTVTDPFQSPKIQRLKTKSTQPSDRSQEAIRKAFKFPDIEYPSAPLGCSQFYLQDTNILQQNKVKPLDSSSTNPSTSSTSSNKSKISNNKKYNTAKLKTTKSSNTINKYPEFSTTSKPTCDREGLFPEVEYPLNAWETWKPNYWPLTSFRPKKNDNEPYSYSKVETNLKSRKGPSSKNSITKDSEPKSVPLTKSRNNDTPVLLQVDTTESTFPNYTTFCDRLSTAILDESKNDAYLEKKEECFNFSNQTLPAFIATKTPCVSNDDPTSISQFKMYNDDKKPTVSSDNEIASVPDVINAVVFESTDNKDSCFEDNVINSNKSSAFDVEEEFTTDVPDFDENMWLLSMSTVSPLSVVDIDESWANVVVIDPYQSVPEIDELDQCYIAV